MRGIVLAMVLVTIAAANGCGDEPAAVPAMATPTPTPSRSSLCIATPSVCECRTDLGGHECTPTPMATGTPTPTYTGPPRCHDDNECMRLHQGYYFCDAA